MLAAAPAFAQQAPAVALPTWEIAPAFTVNRNQATQSTGTGIDLALAANFGSHAAFEGSVAREFRGVTSLGAGGRISTGFFDPGSGDGIPGRFFAHALAGAESGAGENQMIALVGAGSDVVFPVGPRGFTLHLGLDYRFTPAQKGGSPLFAGWQVVVGTVVGPRLIR
jgi:hypothetical protein